jgi:hypothetical protein
MSGQTLIPAALAVGILMSLGARGVSAPEKKSLSAEDVAKARKIIESDERLKSAGAIIDDPIEDAAVGRALPEYIYS